jgi:hypothetical protein
VDYRSEQQSLVASIIRLRDHSTHIETRSARTPVLTQTAATSSKPIRFKIDSVIIENNDFTFFDNSFPKLKTKSIDFLHFGIVALNVQAENISSDGNLYTATINDMSAQESSGFRVQTLKGKFAFSRHSYPTTEYVSPNFRNQVVVIR